MRLTLEEHGVECYNYAIEILEEAKRTSEGNPSEDAYFRAFNPVQEDIFGYLLEHAFVEPCINLAGIVRPHGITPKGLVFLNELLALKSLFKDL